MNDQACPQRAKRKKTQGRTIEIESVEVKVLPVLLPSPQERERLKVGNGFQAIEDLRAQETERKRRKWSNIFVGTLVSALQTELQHVSTLKINKTALLTYVADDIGQQTEEREGVDRGRKSDEERDTLSECQTETFFPSH